ncbi:ATP-binding cassette sub-family C member 4-like [Diorhabda carinulata]|uniref:ATP-binding cassette sub-family C member 4-like n=1 Tax=Diorhabda carinulata TaxID=1163345 RepID=UPI0025A30ABC|nr:ATP-binding cassette sub-family C member 4-like [Diorhabda carinulata]
MDIAKENYNPNPRDSANVFSVMFFTYTVDMFKKGYRKVLDVDDLYNPIRSDRSALLGDRLEKKWNKHLSKPNKTERRPSLLKTLVATFWPEYLFLGCILVTMDLLVRLTQPIMLGNMLTYFRPGSTTTKTEALYYAGALVALNGASALLINQYIMNAFHYGMKIRAAVCSLIYRKALRLSKTALGETASGKIVNLLSNDVSRFDIVSIFIHHMWVSPTSAIIIMYFLYSEAGYAGILGILVVFLVVPLQSYTGKLSAIYRKQTALKTDERVRLMDEVISGVQVIKMYAWEKPFEKLIKYARKAELKIVTKSSYVRALFMTFNLFTTRAALFATLLTMVLTDQQITAAKVFVFMSYFNTLSQTMSAMFVRGIAEIAELFVAIRRVQSFLLNEEFHTVIKCQNNNEKIFFNKTLISLKDLTVKWNLATKDNALKKINLDVNVGKLVGIIGPVGSGKSSLLQTILGELEVVHGSIEVNGTISYASQEPWVFAATIRQNITFGSDFDKKKYNEVVKSCTLEKDFKQFEHGDLTIVGERGASLSGGQKARINLARALYRDAAIYLLDDPLSAVDIHVSKHLYDKCINGFLANKTRILVTHQVHHLKNADHIIILNNGVIENEGSFKELSSSDNLYAKLLTSEPESTEEERQKQAETSKITRKKSIKSRQSSLASGVSELSIPEALLQEGNESEDDEPEIRMKDLQEESSKGKIKGSLFWNYLIRGGNTPFVCFVLFLYVLSQVVASSVDFFVSKWVNIEESRNGTSFLNVTEDVVIKHTEWSTMTCVDVFAAGLAVLFLVAISRSMLFYKLAMWSSQNLHDMMFNSVIAAPMRFFDTNPSGRILNRFSKDIGAIDEWLPKAILDAGQIILMMCGSLILVAIVNPYFLIFVFILAFFFLTMRHVYLKSSKNIKRLEGIMRSPVFTHLNATLQGLTTIRSFGAQKILMAEFDKHQDSHTSAWFMYIAASSAFGFYLDVLCFFFITTITFSLLCFGEALNLKGGEIGLAITQATALTGMVQWGIRQSAEVTNQLMSVERVLEYKALPAEKQPDVPKKPEKSWPKKGHIRFKNMGLRYIENGPLTLKNLDLSINPNEKVGIVGRTGAGKSSLIAALFRLAKVEGEINIDDIDTKDLILEDLRSKISIIPQDPVLFSGTLRYNLDPFEEYPDEVLYKAIEDVELKDPANVINRLENRVMDRGSNYSVGQRQLICLARAIIRNNKILMLDEATANVDPQTDALIQKTIRKKFANCTVLTVAHRLNTIMDSDKVLVMDSGAMVEFDHPYLLLQNPNGVFYKMVTESGKNLGEQLTKIAKENYERHPPLPE